MSLWDRYAYDRVSDYIYFGYRKSLNLPYAQFLVAECTTENSLDDYIRDNIK